MIKRFSLLFRTLKYLKFIQVYYQLYYRVRKKVMRSQSLAGTSGFVRATSKLNLQHHHNFMHAQVDFNSWKFSFLNQEVTFMNGKINWNYDNNGQLWGYNLNYFEFLFDPKCDREVGQNLIENYCLHFEDLSFGLDPYPTSLRIINWIKFIVRWDIQSTNIDHVLFKQTKILERSLEYHLLANHLLENGFALLYAAYYFKSENIYKKAKRIITSEIEEQTFQDGGHYERSPMYHQILLYKLLECVNLLRNNHWQNDELLEELTFSAEKMLKWSQAISIESEIPLLKDSSPETTPSLDFLNSYASTLNIRIRTIAEMRDSGFRKLQSNQIVCVTDIGGVSPSYQPGHSHADTFNFLVYESGIPIIVETGVSTYNLTARRQLERSTSAHNCVTINGENLSEVWGGFRVGRRAKVNILKDEKNHVVARHNGFTRFGIKVERSFLCEDNSLEVVDKIHGDLEKNEARSYLHFNPELELKLIDNQIVIGPLKITFEGFHEMHQEKYKFARGFNSLAEGTRLNLKPSNLTKIIIAYVN